jgi:hypothetical protein
MADLPAFDAVSLDVGGVLVVPHRRMLGDALTRTGVLLAGTCPAVAPTGRTAE